MRIDQVYAEAFGPFRKSTLPLAKGMTVLHGPNEVGKSSWFAAIYAGLCGRRRARGRGTAFQADFKQRHKPWDSRGWRVGVDIAFDDGRQLRVLNNLANGTTELTDLVTDARLAVEELERRVGMSLISDSTFDGARLLGLNRSSARSTLFVWQAEILKVASDADELQEYLQRAATNDSVDVTAEHALTILAELRSQRVGSASVGKRPLRAATEELDLARAAADDARDTYQQLQDLLRSRTALMGSLSAIDDQLQEVARHKVWIEIDALQSRVDRVTSLTTERDAHAAPPPADAQLISRARGLVVSHAERQAPEPLPDGPSAEQIQADIEALPAAEPGDVQPHESVVESMAAFTRARTMLQAHESSPPDESVLPETPMTAEDLRSAATLLAAPPPTPAEVFTHPQTADELRAAASNLEQVPEAPAPPEVNADPDALRELATRLSQIPEPPEAPPVTGVSSDELHALAANLDLPGPAAPAPVDAPLTVDELRGAAAVLDTPTPADADPSLRGRIELLRRAHDEAMAAHQQAVVAHAESEQAYSRARADAEAEADRYQEERRRFDEAQAEYEVALARWESTAAQAPTASDQSTVTTRPNPFLIVLGVAAILAAFGVGALGLIIPAGAAGAVGALLIVVALLGSRSSAAAHAPEVARAPRPPRPVAPNPPSPPATLLHAPPGPPPAAPEPPRDLHNLQAQLDEAARTRAAHDQSMAEVAARLQAVGLSADAGVLRDLANQVEAALAAEAAVAQHEARLEEHRASLRARGLPDTAAELRQLAAAVSRHAEQHERFAAQTEALDALQADLDGRGLPADPVALRTLADDLSEHARRVVLHTRASEARDVLASQLRSQDLPDDPAALRDIARRMDAAEGERQRVAAYEQRVDECRHRLGALDLPAEPDGLRELARRIDDAEGAAARRLAYDSRAEELRRALDVAGQRLRETLAAREVMPRDEESLDGMHERYVADCARRADLRAASSRLGDLQEALAARRLVEERHAAEWRRHEQQDADAHALAAQLGVDQEGVDPVAAIGDWVGEQEARQAAAAERKAAEAALEEALVGDTVDLLEERLASLLREAGERPAESVEQIVDRQAALLRRQRAAQEQIADLGGKIDAMDQTMPSVAAAIEREAAAETALEQVTTLAAVLDLATEHLGQAKERAHATIAPALASTLRPWLPAITAGRYTDVDIDPESLVVKLLDPDGRFRSAQLLSHGTAEQAYLLLRLALAQHLGNGLETIPLFLDDVTVQSDVDRTIAILELLHSLSTDRQIVLFTQEAEVVEWGNFGARR